MKLRLRFLLLLTAIFIGFVFVTWLLSLQLMNQVNQKWGSQFIERQVLFDKYRTLSHLIDEIELARKMAADPDVIQMALHESDPLIRQRGIATMENNYHFNFSDHSYFAAIAKSGNYYFNDAANQYQGKQLRYVLSPANSNDKWFYATMADGKEYQVNLDPDIHLGVTKVWINVLIKNGRDVLGVIGTGIDLTSFLKETVSISQQGVHNLFIDKSMAIQLNTDPRMIDYMSIAKDVSHRLRVDVLLKNPVDVERLQFALKELELSPDKTQTFWVDYEGGKQLLGVAYLPEVGWYDLTLMDAHSLVLIEDKLRVPILFGAAFLIALIAMGAALRRWVLKPISVLQKSTDKIQQGDFDIDYQVLGSGEMGHLLTSFSGMAKYVRDTNRELENRVRERTDELRQLVDQQRAILDNRLVGIAIVRDRKVVWCNHAYEIIYGYNKGELIGVTPRQLYVNEEDYQAIGSAYANIGKEGIVRNQLEFVRKDGQRIWLDMSGSLLHEDTQEVLWVFVDVTERKIAEQNQSRLARALKLLSQCDSALVRIEREHELLSEISKLAVEIGGYMMAWVGFAENNTDKTVRPVAQSGYEEGYLETIRVTWADTEYGQGPVGTAIKTGETSVIRDFHNNPKMAPWSEAARKRGYNACIALPLTVNKQVLGAFAIYSIDPFAFGKAEVELLEQLANDLAYGIQTLRARVEHEAAQTALKRESEKNVALLRNASDGIHILDVEGNIIEVSDSFCAMLGYRRDEMIGMNVSQFDADHSLSGFSQSIGQQLSQQGRSEFERRHRRKDGTVFDVEISASPLKLDGESVLFSSARDITERKRAEAILRITASVFDNTQEGILITDANNAIIDVNPAFTRITGYSHNEVIGKNPKLLSSGRHGKEFYDKMWQSLGQERVWRGEIWNRRKSGEIFAELLSVAAIVDNDGKVLRYVAMSSDISHIKAHEAELKRVAHYDALTGIPNRVLLADRMKQAIHQTSREQNMMAICYLDLDGFKPINDSLGHDAGDHVLIEVARRIENAIRGGDTVARMGGDEFVVLLLGQERGEECAATLERLLATIANPISVKDTFCMLSASIGVSIYPLDDEDPDTLLRHADQAMYVAKQSGKNRFHIYDPALDRNARVQHEFLKSIRYGLEHDQFELFYQPKINLLTQEMVGAEALIRWRHPERGLLSPAEFLHIIENTELDIELGEWVTATALAQLNDWRSAGLDIEVSINISGYHMESSYFVERLQQQLARYPDLPFGKLQIEVLETVALNDIAVVREIIETCRGLGVGFALDDFGTGYSSLSYLSSLPVDVLKIDQSFVRDMLEDKGDMAIVQGIIALARAFNRQTVAEGIETEDHYRVLLDMGCELGQGYGIARPMTAGELTTWRRV